MRRRTCLHIVYSQHLLRGFWQPLDRLHDASSLSGMLYMGIRAACA